MIFAPPAVLTAGLRALPVLQSGQAQEACATGIMAAAYWGAMSPFKRAAMIWAASWEPASLKWTIS